MLLEKTKVSYCFSYIHVSLFLVSEKGKWNLCVCVCDCWGQNQTESGVIGSLSTQLDIYVIRRLYDWKMVVKAFGSLL